MKGIKKLLTGILAATMIMGTSITAFATSGTEELGTASITVNHTVEDGATDKVITYHYYQILKADILSLDRSKEPAQSGEASYYVTDATLADLLGKTGLFTVTASSTETRWNVELIEKTPKTTGEQIRDALNKDVFKNAVPDAAKGTFTSAAADGTTPTLSASKTGLEPGYYLIISDLGTVAAVQTLGAVEINEKNTFPGVKKEKASKPDIYAMFNIGSTLEYKLEVDIPASVENKDIDVVDTATIGLTLNGAKDAIVVTKKESDGSEVEVTKLTWGEPKATEDGKASVYTTKIDKDIVTANAGKTLVLKYTAKINEKAVVFEPEKNTAHIEYDNYKSAETNPVEVKTIGFEIYKFTTKDGEEKALTGAEFSLWKSATGTTDQIPVVFVKDGTTEDGKAIKYYRVADPTNENEKVAAIEVSGDGLAEVDGIETATYYLQEDKAPTGFNKLTARREMVIGADNAKKNQIYKERVENKSGSVLPSTGGIGTTIFYILGSILIIAGVAYFIVRRKASVE